jgi:hypothetical protein
MRDLHKYCYSIVTACFIALGTGFLSITQYTLSFEKEAKKLAYEVEEMEQIKMDRNTDCEKLKT